MTDPEQLHEEWRPVPDWLRKYVEYIHNTGQRPLACAAFDDDWEPIGPMVRKDLVKAGLIEEHEGYLMLLVEDQP